MKRREFCTIQQSDEREDIYCRFKHTGMWLCETQRGCSKPEARWQPHCRVNEHGGSRSLLDRRANFLSLLTDAFRFWFHKHFSEAEYSHWQTQTHFREILQVFHWFIRPQQVAGNTAFIILLSLRRESITVFSSTGEDPSRLQEETEPCLNSVSVTRPGNRSKSLWTHEPHFTFEARSLEAGLKRPYTRLLYIQTLSWIIKTISFSEVEQVCRDLSRCCRLVNKAQKNKEKLTQHRYTQDSRTKSNTAIYPQCLYLHTNNCVQSKWCCRLTVNDGNNIVSAASVRSHSSSPFALGCSSSREVRERRSAQSLHLFNISADSFLLC